MHLKPRRHDAIRLGNSSDSRDLSWFPCVAPDRQRCNCISALPGCSLFRLGCIRVLARLSRHLAAETPVNPSNWRSPIGCRRGRIQLWPGKPPGNEVRVVRLVSSSFYSFVIWNTIEDRLIQLDFPRSLFIRILDIQSILLRSVL